MTSMKCTNNNAGICCDQCPPGKYVNATCSATQQTKCDDCKPGTYTAQTNSLSHCLLCRTCLPSHELRTLSNCTADKNAVCECKPGSFCTDKDCEHCSPLTECHPGEGVRTKATRTTDTVCEKCEEGTYSNVTDYSSPCIAHTRCEDIDRVLKTPGSLTADAVCVKSPCSSWMLPAGLWSGFVLTILIVAVFMFWRARRKSHRAAKSSVPVSPVEMPPMPDITPDLPSHCQESCTMDSYKLPLYSEDNPIEVCSIKDSFDSSTAITPMKVSSSFAESNHNGSRGYNKSNFFRSHSEPQEDEWCG